MGGNIGGAGSTFTLSSGGGFSAGVVAANGSGVGAVTEGYSGIGRADFQNTGVGSSVWEGGSQLVFQFKDVATDSGAVAQNAGAGTNWDLITNNLNALTVNVTLGSKISILLEGLSSLTAVGNVSTFDPTSTSVYYWKYATNVGPVNLSGFSFDERGVWSSGSYAGGYGGNTYANGTFFVTNVGNDLYIGYTSVPEPGSILLTTLAALGMGGYGWRRRRKKGQAAGDADPVTGAAQTAVVETVAVDAAAVVADQS
jgi:hypothetical protein